MVAGINRPDQNQAVKTDVKLEREQRGFISRITRALETISTAIIAAASVYNGKRFTSTGINNDFTLASPAPRAGATAANIQVFVEGSIQDPGSDYTFATPVLTISGAVIAAGRKIDIWYPV